MAGHVGSLRRLIPLVGLGALLSGCGDAGPRSGPGSLEVRISSPNGAEGSAVVTVFGEGIRSVSTPIGRVFSEHVSDTVRVVLVADVPGDLRFVLSVADTTAVLQGAVLQVADGEDRLRPTTADYTLEFAR